MTARPRRVARRRRSVGRGSHVRWLRERHRRAVLGCCVRCVDSDLHRAVRSRAAEGAVLGHAAVVSTLRHGAERLRRVDLAVQQPILVLDGIAMSVEEYLRTRIVELAVHVADLAESVGVEVPALPDDVWEQVACTVGEIAVRRHGPAAYALSIARPDRTDRLAAF